MLVLVNFQDKLVQYKLGNKVYEINKGLARIFEVNWRYVIYTKRGWKVWMRKKE